MLIEGLMTRFYSPDDNGGGAGDDKGGDGGGADDDDPDDHDDGGAGGGKGDKGDDGGGGKGDTVSKADHQRALDDLHKYKKDKRILQTKLDEQARRIAALEKGKSPDGEDWKKKYEESEAKNQTLRQNFIDGEKYKALVPALNALGLRKGGEKLIDLIDLEELEVEVTDRGRVTVLDVEAFAKKIRQENDWAFEARRSSQVNGGGGGKDNGGGGGKGKTVWTPEKLVEFERECKRKGTPEKYQAAYKEFLEQRKAAKQA